MAMPVTEMMRHATRARTAELRVKSILDEEDAVERASEHCEQRFMPITKDNTHNII
jgi:hypothetical protein